MTYKTNLPSTQQGAALLSALVISMMLVILVSVTANLMNKRLDVAETSLEKFEGMVSIHQKQQELFYLIATQRKTFAGVSTGKNKEGQARFEGVWLSPLSGDEIRVDGFEYEESINGIDIKYSIQAENGLIPINTSDSLWRRIWYNANKIDIGQISVLEDTLIDYADPDDWSRAAGAESSAYRREGLESPPNYLLQSCSELSNIIHWKDVIEEIPSLVNECSLSRSPRVNLNAVPLHLWKKLWPDSYEDIANARASGRWITDETSALAASPELLQIPPVYIYYKGISTFTINVHDKHSSVTTTIRTQRGLLPPFKLRPSAFTAYPSTSVKPKV